MFLFFTRPHHKVAIPFSTTKSQVNVPNGVKMGKWPGWRTNTYVRIKEERINVGKSCLSTLDIFLKMIIRACCLWPVIQSKTISHVQRRRRKEIRHSILLATVQLLNCRFSKQHFGGPRSSSMYWKNTDKNAFKQPQPTVNTAGSYLTIVDDFWLFLTISNCTKLFLLRNEFKWGHLPVWRVDGWENNKRFTLFDPALLSDTHTG